MTSGNLSEEPIAKDNDEALRRLGDIADYFLLHNRNIYARYDDSVCMVEEGNQLIRRARGYAPYPIHLPFVSDEVLAVGAELKNTFCATKDNYAFVSQHIGDMENIETLDHFSTTVQLYKRLFRLNPRILACDLHPDYLATRYAYEIAEREGVKVIPVQHHHAHIVSCMVENEVTQPVIGVAFDGTGLGSDGKIWGGEFLVADYKGFVRKGHLEYVPLPGGDIAVKKPARMALSYLYSLLGEESWDENLPPFRWLDREEREIVLQQIRRRLNSPLTSSCGRLFDAVSALIGIRGIADYEAQPAIELEAAALEDAPAEGYPFSTTNEEGTKVIRLAEIFRGIISDLRRGNSTAFISARFHHTVARIVAAMCYLIREETAINTVALSGGVFQNRLLLRLTTKRLKDIGFEVLNHHQVPTNDGGISLGQAVIANFHYEVLPKANLPKG
jgi:hydrogenase maturation protein HypF